MNKVTISESQLKSLISHEVKKVLGERTISEAEVVSTGNSGRRPSSVGSSRAEDVTREESEFLISLAQEVASQLGQRVSLPSPGARSRTWDQIEYDLYDEGGLTYTTFITLEKLGDGRYRVSADADTRTPDGIEAFQREYVVIEDRGGLGPSDVTSRLVGQFADMLEDAEMQGHKSASYFDPAGRNPPGI